MDRAAEMGALSRFVAGTAGSILLGLAIFRMQTFQPDAPWFQCVSVGALLAGVLALVRVGRPTQALSLVAAFALVHLGYAWTQGWGRAVAEWTYSLVLGGGTFLASVIFDRLAEEGYRFGKFALLGPLVAGVYLAATPLVLVGPDRGVDGLGVLIRHVFVGLIIGDAVGLGVEIVELLPPVGRRASGVASGA